MPPEWWVRYWNPDGGSRMDRVHARTPENAAQNFMEQFGPDVGEMRVQVSVGLIWRTYDVVAEAHITYRVKEIQ